MEISFSSRKMQKTCNSRKEMQVRYGARTAKSLQRRLAELKAAGTLDDVKHLPAARCHELSGDRKGKLAVDLVHPKRLVFEPDHDPMPTRPDGGLDWTQVTHVRVIDVMDYH